MSDAPDGPLDTRGGMEEGDPGLEGATETGGSAAKHAETDTSGDADGGRLVGEKETDGEGL